MNAGPGADGEARAAASSGESPADAPAGEARADAAAARGDCLLVVNRHARSGQAPLDPAIEVLARSGRAPIVLEVESPVDLAKEIEAALTPSVARVVVAGGDGTVNSALPPVIRAGLPLGVIPLGTGNDLARTLNLPADPLGAAEVIARGATRRIDVGTVNGKYFVNAAGIGFSAELQRDLDSRTKGMLGPLAYPIGVLRRWRSHRAFTVSIRGDGLAYRHSVIQVTVANGRFYGAGMTAHEDARIDDGTLDIVLVLPRPLWHYVRSAFRLKRGVYSKDTPVVALHATRFELVTRRRRAVTTDGEISTFTPASFAVSPHALEVYAPDASA